ncbi:sialate O-acetylesterase [Labilibaculum euxinus]
MKYRLLYAFFLLFVFFRTSAKVFLPAIISDNMVLQQQSEVTLWGKALFGEKININTSWGKNYFTTSGKDERWSLIIKTPKASANQTITIKGENTIVIKNVLIGEVWLCSGQSNMDFPVAKILRWQTGVINYEEVIQEANYPEIRLFHIDQKLSPERELDSCNGHWEICNSESVKTFSAVGYFFGRKLYQNLNVPIGLIQSTWGGTPAEAWTKMEVMEHDSVYTALINEFYSSRDHYPQDLKQYETNLKNYELEVAKLASANTDEKIKKPSKPKGIYHNKALSTLWNGMIHPIINYSIKGVVWYQGESNSIRYNDYQYVFTKMIESWRTEWQQLEMPFYFVQIAPHYKQPPQIREAQLKTWQSGNNTGMAVITDAGDSINIHPHNKQIPGERLANWALAKTYKKKIPFSGPRFVSMKIKDHQAVLSFDFCNNGLMCPNDSIKGFTAASSNGVFYPAKATINGGKIIVSSEQVNQIENVRYGWGNFFRANLYNIEGLPASPFRTDTTK